MNDTINLSCSLSNNFFKPEGNFIVGCTVKDGGQDAIGSFNIIYSHDGGPGKLDFQISKDLVGNLITNGIDGMIDKIGKLFMP